MADPAAPPAAGAAPGAEPKVDPYKELKLQLNQQYHSFPYTENDLPYITGDFRWSQKKILNIGATQVYRGLANEVDQPHGWGVMQDHSGCSQECAEWNNGVANGRGIFRDPNGGVFYGNWREGKRDGPGCLVDKDGKVFVELYTGGNLDKRVKWKLDKEHKICLKCGTRFLEGTNAMECRYHPDKLDWEERYECCGALLKHNPRGCSVDYHIHQPRE